jgi:hypothetical protein
MIKGIYDIREQYPLSLEDAQHELAAYRADIPDSPLPGAIETARTLGIKYPQTKENGEKSDWVMTTDLPLAIHNSIGELELLAISIKPDQEWKKRRTYELLLVEKTYWEKRGVCWLLITPEQYDSRITLTLRCTMPWAIGTIVNIDALNIAAQVFTNNYGHSLTHILKQLSLKLGDKDNLDYAQRAFWQAAWAGVIKLDLRRGWRPHIPPIQLADDEFADLNPIARRRSAWI